MFRRRASRRSSAACAWSRRISRRCAARAARDTSGTGQLMPAVSAEARSDSTRHVLAQRLEQSRRHPAPRRAARALSLHRRLAGARTLVVGRSGAQRRAAAARAAHRVKAVEIRFLDPVYAAVARRSGRRPAHRGPVTPADGRPAAGRARSPSSSRWCSRTGAACSACSRSPRETRASTRHRAARGHRDVRDRDHGRRGDHLQQGHGGAARGRDVHARAGLAGRHGGRGAGVDRARGRRQQREDRDPRARGPSRSARWRSKAPACGSRRSSKTSPARFNLNSLVQWQGAPINTSRSTRIRSRCSQELLRRLDIDTALRRSAGRLDRPGHRSRSRRAAKTRCT